ncbi:MAG: TetR family transcriptional regulator [bacterium]|nr:TetR family transcriptional regulator [bacterium]
MSAAGGGRRRRGRPVGPSTTRETILEAAHRAFTADGFEGTSLRRVARDAGVDPALVHHYFADKTTLFLHSARIAFDPRRVIARIVPGGRSGVGVRVLRHALPLWESPLGRSLVAAARRNPEAYRTFGRVMGQSISAAADEVLADVPAPERALRVAKVETVMAGLFTGRYLMEIEPAASIPPEQVVREWAPLLQALIDGEL